MADLKRKENISKKAVMLNIRKDELDKLSTSLPVKDMSILWNMLTYLMRQDKSIEISVTQDISKANTVREERKERKKKVNERLKRIHFSDEKRSLYFVQKQKEYEVEVSEKLLELEEWYDDFMTFEGRTPDELEFSKKLNEIKDELKEMQELVGGYIETVMFTDNLIIVCNEEGRLIPLPKNMMGIHGTFFVVGTEGDEFRSLTDEEVMACELLINGGKHNGKMFGMRKE